MHAVGAFVMGGNGEHPLVCFGLGSSVVALVEWLHSHRISIKTHSEMPCCAKSLTLHSTHLIILKTNKVLTLEHFSDRFSTLLWPQEDRHDMKEASFYAAVMSKLRDQCCAHWALDNVTYSYMLHYSAEISIRLMYFMILKSGWFIVPVHDNNH